MRKSYTDIPEGQVHYRYAGVGRPVIMLHISGGSSDEYEKVGDIIASHGFACYAIDFPGFGNSDRPLRATFEDHYSLDDYVNYVISFMDAMKIKKAYFIGNLVGANIAALAAYRFPERVFGLSLGEVCYYAHIPNFKDRVKGPYYAPVFPTDDGRYLLEYWDRLARHGETAEINNHRLVGMAQAGDLCEAMHWALYDADPFTEIFPKIPCKTVVMAYERYNNIEVEREVSKLIPNAEFEILENASAYVNWANPKLAADIFLKHFKTEDQSVME